MIMFIFRLLDRGYQAPSHVPVNSWMAETVQGDVEVATFRHQLLSGYRVASTPVLGGLRHEYRLETGPRNLRRDICGPLRTRRRRIRKTAHGHSDQIGRDHV